MVAALQQVRLVPVAVALGAAGLVSRWVLAAAAPEEHSYPAAVQLQVWFYGAGLLVLLAWWLRRTDGGGMWALRGLVWLTGAALAALAVIATIPK